MRRWSRRSPWTFTNSAMASWVGEELKTVGLALSLRHKLGRAAIEISSAAFGWNDVAGMMLADRGWDVGSQPIGLFDHLRLPDVRARDDGDLPPAYTPEFRATDNQPGWYAGISAAAPGVGKLQLFHYDNGTTLGTERNHIQAWRTRFWDVGYHVGTGPFSLIAEGLSGNTMISPDGNGPFTTDFYVASLLGSWTDDPWRCTLRVEQFGTAGGFGERGREGTLSANWSPLDGLRTTIELVVVDSYRPERRLAGAPAHAIETQPLAAIRATF